MLIFQTLIRKMKGKKSASLGEHEEERGIFFTVH